MKYINICHSMCKGEKVVKKTDADLPLLLFFVLLPTNKPFGN